MGLILGGADTVRPTALMCFIGKSLQYLLFKVARGGEGPALRTTLWLSKVWASCTKYIYKMYCFNISQFQANVYWAAYLG